MLRRALLRAAPRRGVQTAASFRERYPLWIGGEETEAASGATFEVEDPARRVVLTRVASAGERDVARAVELAHETHEGGAWSRADVRDRAGVLSAISAGLRERVVELAELESLQTGRCVREMRAQLARLPEWFEYFGALARTSEGRTTPFLGPYLNYVEALPLGAVAQITPWNHPLLIAVKKLAPALAAGNSVVLKPSELAPVAVLELARICQAAGLPPGALSVLPGLGAEAGAALCAHPLVRKVDFTGGTPTGRAVGAAAGANIASVVSELGGKAPVVVFEDADVEQAVNGAAFAAFVASGQTCIMGARLLVQKGIYEEVLDRFVAKARAIRLGDPMAEGTQMGPMASAAQLERVLMYTKIAEEEGATVLAGGARPPAAGLPPACRDGYFVEPTVVAAEPWMRCAREEVFGPFVVAYPFEDEEDAVRLANDSPFGLAAAVWTRDLARAHRVAQRMEAGIVWCNDHHRNDPSSPWGGMKDSGVGRENGREALREYTQARSIIVRTSDERFDWFEDPDARYS